MGKVIQPDIERAEVKVKGYRFGFLYGLGLIGVFFAALIFGIIYGERAHVSSRDLYIAGIACGIAALLFIALTVSEICAERAIKKRDCVLLYKDGMTVYVTKPGHERGYIFLKYGEIEDYGFIHIVRGKGSGESLPIFRTKHQSSGTYLFGNLNNYGYMRITDKDGGYYNVPVGDIEAVRNFLKERTTVKEYIYQRIAGIHDDVIIPLK